MKSIKIGKSLRLFFVVSSLIMLLGIYLTGFKVVHWVSYLVPAFFIFAAITGICPGMFISRTITRDKS